MSIKHTLTASIIMILTMGLLQYINHGENIHPNKSFTTFPKQIGEWVGKEKFLDENIMDVVGVDDYFLCDYNNSKGQWINLYIGFYQSQKEGDLIHSPKNCMPGAGWNITRTAIEQLDIPAPNPGWNVARASVGEADVSETHSEKMKTIKLIVQKGPQKQIMLYWFQSRGRIISSEYMQKVWLVVDSITRHRTDGSFVRLIAPVSGNDEAMSLDRLKDFAKQLMPILNKHIPS